MKSKNNNLKLRVWNDNQGFVQFRSCNDPEWFVYILGNPEENNHIGKDYGTIEQCVGLPDKNKVLAYAGDIVRRYYRDGSFLDWIIYWNQEHSAFYARWMYSKNINYPIDRTWLKRRVIVGNIHENKELLRKPKK